MGLKPIKEDPLKWGAEKACAIWGRKPPNPWGEVGNEGEKAWLDTTENPTGDIVKQAQEKSDKHRANSKWNF